VQIAARFIVFADPNRPPTGNKIVNSSPEFQGDFSSPDNKRIQWLNIQGETGDNIPFFARSNPIGRR
jgi:hypothetical protein